MRARAGGSMFQPGTRWFASKPGSSGGASGRRVSPAQRAIEYSLTFRQSVVRPMPRASAALE